MKITTWNINGLRAVLGKGAWKWFREYSPDVFCLQEIKSRPDQLNKDQQKLFEGFHTTWNPAQRPGYSGVATIDRQPSQEVLLGLGEGRFDDEGRVIRTRYPGFYLYNVYFPNGQRDHDRLTYKLDFYARLLEIVDDLHAKGEQVVICGDFNTAHHEIDLKNPKANENTSGFLLEERAWIDCYIEHGLVDVFRLLYPEKIQYTWWTYITNARARNVGWRLDYFMVSQSFVPRVQDVVIHDEVLGSDHCPVTMVLRED